MNAEALRQAAHRLGLELSAEQVLAFEQFEEHLYKANEVMNLTRVRREECWLRHFVDSLLLSPFILEGAKVLDIGTGPGFPAWPLACTRPNLHVTALDSSGKMLGFLQKQPLPNLRPVLDRAESWGRRDEFDFVTGRAVAPLGIQLEVSAPAARVGAVVVPMRTPNDLQDIKSFPAAELGLQLEQVEHVPLLGTDVVRVFPVFRKVAKTPRLYPRSWAEIKRQPLSA